MTELIETTKYHTLPSGVQMVSKRFQEWGNSGGYAYVCFPWVDRHQWHAFSLFENPKAPQERQIFMQRTGDWTSRVHDLLQRDSVRPVFIMGPFPSPYKNAIKYDNQILVAGGIGITPALSVIRAHQDHRCVNLIWAVRDPAMLQFFLEHALLDNRGWNLIFYTGKEPLVSSLIDGLENTNVCIIQGRPNLDDIIPNIVYGFETGKGRPDRYLPEKKAKAIEKLRERLTVLDTAPDMSPKDKFCNLAKYANGLGYIFHDLVISLNNVDENLRLKDSTASVSLETVTSWSSGSKEAGAWDDEHMDDPESGYVVNTGYDSSQRTSVVEKALRKFRGLQKRRQFRKSSLTHHIKLVDDFNEVELPLMLDGCSSVLQVEQQPNCVSDQKPRDSIVRDQWDGIMGGLMDGMSQNFKPWEYHREAGSFVSKLDPTMVKSTWGILYCGGQGKLLTSLQKAAKDVGIKLHEESFSW